MSKFPSLLAMYDKLCRFFPQVTVSSFPSAASEDKLVGHHRGNRCFRCSAFFLSGEIRPPFFLFSERPTE